MACMKLELDGIHDSVDDVLVVLMALTMVGARGASLPKTMVQAASLEPLPPVITVLTLTRWIMETLYPWGTIFRVNEVMVRADRNSEVW